jgi:MinD-like ATPase involved in chromosome partitioning or flagellar assembly
MNMQHDQARRLRELAQEARTNLTLESRAPTVVAIAGGGSQVGATTVAKLLAAEFSRRSLSTKLLEASEGWDRQQSGTDLLLIDAGAGYSDRTAPIWQLANLVLVVTTGEQEAVLATYSTLKRAKSANYTLPIWLVANRCENAFAAEVLYQRISDSCRKFLRCSVSRAPWLPRWDANEEPSAAGSRVAALAQLICNQTSSARLPALSQQAA